MSLTEESNRGLGYNVPVRTAVFRRDDGELEFRMEIMEESDYSPTKWQRFKTWIRNFRRR